MWKNVGGPDFQWKLKYVCQGKAPGVSCGVENVLSLDYGKRNIHCLVLTLPLDITTPLFSYRGGLMS